MFVRLFETPHKKIRKFRLSVLWHNLGSQFGSYYEKTVSTFVFALNKCIW